jgi:hypothetical protein
MHPIELRLKANTISPGDLIVTVQDQTFEFLKSSSNPEIRVSAYLDRDWPMVENRFEELYLSEVLSFKVTSISAGSKTRKVSLPCAMTSGEQLTLTVRR